MFVEMKNVIMNKMQVVRMKIVVIVLDIYK